MLKARASKLEVRATGPETGAPDLITQFESLLDQVWDSEAEWRLNDRIDALCASKPDHCGAKATR